MSFDWNDAAIEQLKTLWADGESCAQISAVMGVGSRNAVIGKARRLNLEARKTVKSLRHGPAPGSAKNRKTATQMVATLAPIPMMRGPVLVEPNASARIAITDLTSSTCRWPIGDPSDHDFQYCGHGPRENAPYCEYHCNMAYTAQRAKPKSGGYFRVGTTLNSRSS
jgi:GcrA cell cycle regulator